jgi:hypothetical protein
MSSVPTASSQLGDVEVNAKKGRDQWRLPRWRCFGAETARQDATRRRTTIGPIESSRRSPCSAFMRSRYLLRQGGARSAGQLPKVDGVLVRVDPISEGQNRITLDAMLRDVASRGAWVSAHPDVILRMGVKQVLHRTKHLGRGTDAELYRSVRQFPDRCAPNSLTAS